MLIFWKARLAVLAVPKTGSTAIERALAPFADAAIVNPPNLKHCTVRKYRHELADFFERQGQRPLQLVAIMREPVSWLESWYRYRTRPDLRGQPNSTASIDFETFVSAYLAEDVPDFARVGAQATFLEGGVDHLFRYDRQAPFLSFLQDRLGREITLPRANVSPEAAVDLSADLHRRLRTERPADFDLWAGIMRRWP